MIPSRRIVPRRRRPLWLCPAKSWVYILFLESEMQATARSFDLSAALILLEALQERAAALPTANVPSAWEAAWIACLNDQQIWTDIAEAEFGTVMEHLAKTCAPYR